ncbi:MAG: AI-2E family transporter [Desulfobacterales bacterium]|nr:AI-2E family transporter [Desulfobacterales bacterium]
MSQQTCSSGRGEPPSPMVLRYFLLLFLGAILALGRLLWPFASILILSFLLAGLFRPVYLFLLRKRFTATFSSLATCILIVLLVFVPLLFFVGALSQEMLGFYQQIKGTDLGLKLKELIQAPMVTQAREIFAGFGFDLEPQKLSNTLAEVSTAIGLFIYGQVSAWAANIMNFVISFFLMIIVIFFYLSEHQRFLDFMMRLSPLPDDQEQQLVTKFVEIAGAVLIGNGICGIIQGVLGGLVFALFDLGPPLLWGGIMAILAFLPIFGIGLVLLPAALIMFLKGSIGVGVFLIIFYAVLSFGIEYLFKPRLVGRRVKMHTLLVFLAILGGLKVFGVLGIIYGPLIVTTFLTLAEIYLENYDQYVKGGMDRRQRTGTGDRGQKTEGPGGSNEC